MPTNTITVTYGIETPMRDGVVLRSTVYRPNDAEPHPALLTRTPYGRDLGVNSAWFNPPTVAAAGFAVVLQDCRGRFGSDGDFFPSVNEADGGEDTIGWLRRQPWCDGSVGMWGRSYVAETQWRAALRRPDGLKALAAGTSCDPTGAGVRWIAAAPGWAAGTCPDGTSVAEVAAASANGSLGGWSGGRS